MMTLPPELQLNFQTQVNQYEEAQKMEFLSTLEEMALERGQEIGQERGAKETRRQDILDLLQKRFNTLPETLVKAINDIEDLAWLKQLLVETISVNSTEEFEQLIKDKNSRSN